MSADAYLRFMGRYSGPLAVPFADQAGVGNGGSGGPGSAGGSGGRRALDVGCGPGVLTAELVRRLGAGAVCAAEPSPSFAAAARERLPGVDVRSAAAESLPFPDDSFDTVLAQLVVHFMADPVAGLREMARVARPGGTVAACVWDHGGGRGPLSSFWAAARDLDPAVRGDTGQAGVRQGHLAELFAEAGLDRVRSGVLEVSVRHGSFEDWWEPFTLGVGPVGDYIAKLSPEQRVALREHCRAQFPAGPFEVGACAWVATSQV